MIDIHNHILYGVDDGSQSQEESLNMLITAQSMGFTGVILTPHYMMYRGFTSNVENNKKIFEELKEAATQAEIKIELYLGNEIFYEYAVANAIDSGAFKTLGSTDYYLVETKRKGVSVIALQNFMKSLQNGGKQVIFAHPERYDFIQEDPNRLFEFIDKGILVQGNYLSLVDYYGQAAQNTLKIMLEHGMVSFMGSDAHQSEGYELYPRAKEVGSEIIGETAWMEIMKNNPRKLIDGKPIEVTPKKYKPKNFKKFF